MGEKCFPSAKDAQKAGVKLRFVISPGVGIGPGKAALLEGIRETGSISAAGRLTGMGYKRAWFLVEAMNSHFVEPLVTTSKGGRLGGGANVTQLGEDVLAAYRQMETMATKACTPTLRKLQRKITAVKLDRV